MISETVIKLFQYCRHQLKVHGLQRFMKINLAPGFTKFISRFRMKVLAKTTTSWSLYRTFNSPFSCGLPNQYSDVISQFIFFVFNHTHNNNNISSNSFSSQQNRLNNLSLAAVLIQYDSCIQVR